MLYGDPGTGKTDLAGSAPQPYFVVVGDPNEIVTLKSPGFIKRRGSRDVLWDIVTEDVPLTKEQREKFVPQALDRLRAAFDRAMDLDAKGIIHFETLVIDNATVLQKYIENQGIYIGYQLAGSVEKSALKKYRELGVIVNADSDYKLEQDLMGRIVEYLFTIPKHVVLTAHEHVNSTTDRATRVTTVHSITPQFIGRHRTLIPAFFGSVWRLHVSGQGHGKQFKVTTQKADVVFAKTRIGGILRDEETNLDISKVIDQFKLHDQTQRTQTNAGSRT